MKLERSIILVIAFCLLSSILVGQVFSVRENMEKKDTSLQDSLPIIRPNPLLNRPSTKTVKIDKNGLEYEIRYSARDSQMLDVKGQVVHLYGNAIVGYEGKTLTADYIIFNLKDNIAIAEGQRDANGQLVGMPRFEDGAQNFEARKLKYNFKTNKGLIYDAKTQESDLYILGSRTKYINSDSISQTNSESAVYSSNAIITTCNHPEPHFGIRAKKIKVVPDKVAVVGPANLELAGVATPIMLPFGFFPLTEQQQTGLIRGTFDRNSSRGLGLLDWGWYFPINDRMDFMLTGDIYSRGTFVVKGDLRYKKRYRYDGSLYVNITSLLEENGLDRFRNNSFAVRWSHRQNRKAHPTRTFGGAINFETNNNQRNTFADVQSQFNNSSRSNLNFSKRFPGKNYSFTAALTHSQNTSTRRVEVNFPDARFVVGQSFPFKHKIPKGKERWYEKIAVRYDANLKGRAMGTDTTFFTQETLDDIQVGLKQYGKIDANFTALKYFTLTPFADVTEVWNLKALDKYLDPTLTITSDSVEVNPGEYQVVYDTTSYGTVQERFKTGFNPYHLFNTGLTLKTKIFGTLLFKKGWLRGLRHQITPTITYNFRPGYNEDNWLDYYRTVDTDIRAEENNPQTYGLHDMSIFTRPSNSGEQQSVRFNVGNRFEGKYYSKKDSTSKKFTLINTLNIGTSYNFAKDSQRWDVISFSGNTSLIKGVSSLRFGMRLDPYALEENGTRSNDFHYKETGKLLRFVTANLQLSTNFTVKKIREVFQPKSKYNRSRKDDNNPDNMSFLDWIDNFSISHNFNLRLDRTRAGKDTLIVSAHSIRGQGNIELSRKWRLNISNISYEIKNKRFVYPALGFSRDLHCWQLDMMWYPSAGTYSFSLRAKPGSLGFLNLPWGQNRFNVPRF